MNIAYSSSDFYFKPTCVSIYSLLKNSSKKHNIYLLSSGVSDSNKLKIKKIVEAAGSAIEIIEIECFLEKKANEFRLPKMRGNYSTYARIFLAEILPNVDDILLVDSDTLVLGDLSEIAEYKNDYCMLACRDYVISNRHSRHEDSKLSRANYWNMGVLYLNLAKWRSLNMVKYIDENFDREYSPKIADQSLINKYLSNFIGTIEIKFNFYTYFHYNFDYTYYLKLNNNTQFLTRQEFEACKKDPIIIHFVGTWYERPWFKGNISPFKKIYEKYWIECFSINHILSKPKLTFKNQAYDFLSLYIYKLVGVKAYFVFRYNIIQKIKNFI